jgi:hypothetical protein
VRQTLSHDLWLVYAIFDPEMRHGRYVFFRFRTFPEGPEKQQAIDAIHPPTRKSNRPGSRLGGITALAYSNFKSQQPLQGRPNMKRTK